MKKLLYLLLACAVVAAAYAATITYNVTLVLPVAATDTTIYVPTAQSTLVADPATYGGQYAAVAYRSLLYPTPLAAGTPTDPQAEWIGINSKTRNMLGVTRGLYSSTPRAMETQQVWQLYAAVVGTATPTFTATVTNTPTNTFTPTPTFTPTATRTSTPIPRWTVVLSNQTPVVVVVPGTSTNTVLSMAIIAATAPVTAGNLAYLCDANSCTLSASAAFGVPITIGVAVH